MASTAAPHHDGSGMYVSDPVPRLGQDVRVRVRVPRSSGYLGVRLRSTDDAEFRIVPARRILSTPWEDWYEAGLRIANPLTLYRFMLLRKDGSFDWLTAMGVVDRETGDSADFRATVFPAERQECEAMCDLWRELTAV